MKKIDRDKVLTAVTIILGVAVAGLVIFLAVMIFTKPPQDKEYSRDSYYQLVNEVTPDKIKFYVHDSQLYLDNTFSDVVGTIYKREDGTTFIEYNGKEYDLSEDDLIVFNVKKAED